MPRISGMFNRSASGDLSATHATTVETYASIQHNQNSYINISSVQEKSIPPTLKLKYSKNNCNVHLSLEI